MNKNRVSLDASNSSLMKSNNAVDPSLQLITSHHTYTDTMILRVYVH